MIPGTYFIFLNLNSETVYTAPCSITNQYYSSRVQRPQVTLPLFTIIPLHLPVDYHAIWAWAGLGNGQMGVRVLTENDIAAAYEDIITRLRKIVSFFQNQVIWFN